MHQSGFSNSIRLGDRELFVETAYLPDQSKIVSQISENGHVLDDYQFELDEGATDEQIKSILEEKHGVVSTDWELLSYVHRKVKESNHTQSLNKMGLVLLKRNLLTEAIDCFQEAISHDSDCVESYINLGNAHVQAELFAFLWTEWDLNPRPPGILKNRFFLFSCKPGATTKLSYRPEAVIPVFC